MQDLDSGGVKKVFSIFRKRYSSQVLRRKTSFFSIFPIYSIKKKNHNQKQRIDVSSITNSDHQDLRNYGISIHPEVFLKSNFKHIKRLSNFTLKTPCLSFEYKKASEESWYGNTLELSFHDNEGPEPFIPELYLFFRIMTQLEPNSHSKIHTYRFIVSRISAYLIKILTYFIREVSQFDIEIELTNKVVARHASEIESVLKNTDLIYLTVNTHTYMPDMYIVDSTRKFKYNIQKTDSDDLGWMDILIRRQRFLNVYIHVKDLYLKIQDKSDIVFQPTSWFLEKLSLKELIQKNYNFTKFNSITIKEEIGWMHACDYPELLQIISITCDNIRIIIFVKNLAFQNRG